MRHSWNVTPGDAVRCTEDGGVTMNGQELHGRSRRSFPSVLGLAFVLCLSAFSERALFAFNLSPKPLVWFNQNPPPPIPPDVPPQVLIGEDFTFRVRFNNGLVNGLPPLVPGTITGYGPFIDLVLDAGGANIGKNPPCQCDGMTFVTANMIDVNGGAVPLVYHQSVAAPCPQSLAPLNVSSNHPFTGVQPVQVPAGSQLVTLELPFGSFDPAQPEIVVEVTAHVSPLADEHHQLNIFARGGFRYGEDALDKSSTDCPVLSDINSNTTPPCTNQLTDPNSWAAKAWTTPLVIIVNKTYLGPENETATGPNFIQRYQVTVDVANGQTVTNVNLTDQLPINMAYHKVDSVVFSYPSNISSPCFPYSPPFQAPTPPDQAYSGSANWLILKCPSITGGVHPLPQAAPIHDATITFEFFIPQFDANGAPVLDPNCAPVKSYNYVEADGNWTPIDSCDTHPVQVGFNMFAYPLFDKCLAIQKTVVDLSGVPPAHPIPGDTLQYTLNFQLSDFKTAGNLKLQDVLSDGQTLVPTSLMLTVADQCGTTSGPIPSLDWSAPSLPCGAGAPPPRTQLNIDVSAAMNHLGGHPGGILTGGYATLAAPNVPATGTITFHTLIDDQYQCSVPSPHDQYVDKDDPLTNTVSLTADILNNGNICATTATPTGVIAQDASKVAFFIATDFLEKTVYQVQAAAGHPTSCGPTPPCPSKPEVYPGDLVTFRLKKTIPSSDAETLTIQDWLPLPIFHLPSGFTLTGSACGPASPASGFACQVTIPTWTPPPPPTLIPPPDPVANSVTFNYGTFYNTNNLPQNIDLLFTLTVTNDPFADGLYLTNEAQECESNTFGTIFCQTAIAQIHVREPALRITKGVVAASNSNAVFTPPQGGLNLTFTPPGTPSCPRFAGTITTGTVFDHVVSNADANDVVTFAIVVANLGGSTAYDIQLQDLFPFDPITGYPNCFGPVVLPNSFCLKDGTGGPLPPGATGNSGSGNLTFNLASLPGVGGPPGSNIAVITFDALIVPDVKIKPDCCNNTAKILNYASTPGGQNFVAAGFGGPFQDSALICVRPTAAKTITATSETSTPENNNPRPLAIGEIIRYHLDVVVPETTSASSYKLQDSLPAGLSYLGTITVPQFPPGVTASHPSPLVSVVPSVSTSCGSSTVTFDFGNVTNNSSNTSSQEHIALEFNAVVCNIASNVNPAALPNSFIVLVDNQPVATSNTVSAVVVEPRITITKVASVPLPLSPPSTATYTITLANNSPGATATAFDVQLTDQLPACLSSLTNVQITTSGVVIGPTYSVNPGQTTLNVAVVSMDVNSTVTVHYSATVSCVDCKRLINTANVTWTSLPGLQGTTSNPPNVTGSSTPGSQGSWNGERTGSGGVNSYTASATATLCCMLVSNEKISCNPDGTFTYTFTVTNFANSAASGVTFASISPSGVTITPGPITGFPLPSGGGSGSVTVTIGGTGAHSGTNICFTLVLVGGAGIPPAPLCRTDECITLPNCCVGPPSGMVAWYPLDELQGATAINDIAPPPGSSVNNVGTPKPGPAVGGGAPSPVAGEVAGALYFAGQYVEVQAQAELDFGRGDFSIDAWVRPVDCSHGGGGVLSPIVDKYDGANTGFAFYLDQPAVGLANLHLNINGSPFVSSGTIPTLGSSTWSHIAVTVARPPSPAAGTFYVNGSLAGTFTPAIGSVTNTLPMWIGKTRVPGGSCEIAIDELEIFNRALTQPEIQGISNAGSAGKCRCLLVSNEKIGCNSSGTVTYTFTVTNLSTSTASGVTFTPPTGVTISPSSIATSLLPGVPTNVTVTISGPGAFPGATVCFTAILRQQGPIPLIICKTDHCIKLPKCPPVVVQIPVVLDVFGVAPSHYTSDVVAVNRSGASTQLTVTYLPAPGTPGAGGPAVNLQLGSGQEWRVPDVMAFLRANGWLSLLPPSGPLEAGTLRLTFQDVSDPALVFGGSRATTPNPNATVGGRFGLFLTGTPVGLAPSLSATVFALREDTAYRSNLAIEDVPGGSGPPELTLQVVNGNTGSPSGAPITYLLGPGEWHQFGSILGSVANGYVTITKSGGGSDRFLAYGVVNDGPASGGGTSDGSLVGTDAADGLVPIVLSVTSSGVLYTSELALANPIATSTIATLTYTPAAALSGSGGPYTANVLVGAGQQIRVADVITWLRDTLLMPLPANGVNQGGTLLVSGATAYVRTSNPNPDTVVGGTFGLAYPAVPVSGRARTEAWVYGLVQDAATRANLAIADARAGDPAVLTYVLQIFDADTGSPTPVATVNINLAGGQWAQTTQVLSGTGVTHGYVRVRPLSGTSDYVVYGVLNDGASPGQGTSDGSYVAMSGVQ